VTPTGDIFGKAGQDASTELAWSEFHFWLPSFFGHFCFNYGWTMV